MRKILISIEQEYTEAILDGAKVVELRRSRPRTAKDDELVDDVAFICCGGMVHGYFRIEVYQPVWQLPADSKSAQDFMRWACVTPEKWKEYKPTFSWGIYHAQRFAEPMPLADLGISRAPQSWQYLTEKQYAKLERRAI